MDGSRIAIVCSREKPIRAYVGSTLGSICTVIMPVTSHVKAVPRNLGLGSG